MERTKDVDITGYRQLHSIFILEKVHFWLILVNLLIHIWSTETT